MNVERPTPFGQRTGLFLGVGLVAGASVALSVVLTRLYSAVLGHHLATLALSLALFGVALGGGLVTLFPSLVRPPHLFSRLAALSAFASVSAVVAVIQTLQTKPVDTLDRASVLRVLVLYSVTAVPFTLIGCAVAGALSHARALASRVYFADMLGAAAGSATVVGLLQLGAPRAGLALAVAFGLGSVCFALGSREAHGPFGADERRGGGWLGAAFFLSSISLFAGDYGEQWLTPTTIKHVRVDKAEVVRWNELALVTVDKPSKGMAWLRLDAGAQSAILDARTAPTKHPDELAYALSGAEGPTLVVGAGGGREVRAALSAGQKQVVAVEINRAVAHDVMLGKMLAYSGGLYQKPEVELVVADGRSYIRATPRRFKNIVMSLVDTWAAASVGGLSLAEDGLYTVEAFRDFLAHLTDDGVLVVNRWDPEADRLVALASAALLAEGATAPGAHLYACSHTRSTALVVKKQPLSMAELGKLRGFCKKNRFLEIYAPDAPGSDLRAALVADPWGASREVTSVNVMPPTDERPFFFYNVPARALGATLADQATLRNEQQGLATLFAVIVASVVFALALLLVPLFLRPREVLLAPGRGARLRALGFFAGAGAGFMLVELALVQIFTTFLGHPVYALTVVLTALFLSIGAGSLLAGRVPEGSAQPSAASRAQILTIVLVLAGLGLMRATSAFAGLPFGGRVAFVALVILPIGLLMGAQIPLGVVVTGTRSRTLVAWGLALNGVAGVLAIALGTLLAMHIGFSFLLLAGAVAYFVASLLLPAALPKTTVR
ncbi:MAG: hypothetical protein JNL21_36880 [Myxococcales bacterium]|nr:hypothetical protein [Myxococcales bacterium]